MLFSVAVSRSALRYEERYTPLPGWYALAAFDKRRFPCLSRTRRNNLSGLRKYRRTSRLAEKLK